MEVLIICCHFIQFEHYNIETCHKRVVISHKMSDKIIKPLPKFKSPVWKFFGLPQVKEGDNVIPNQV